MDSNKKRIIGFLGVKSSGKDTAGQYLIDTFGYTKYALGDPVKQICKTMFNLSDDQITDQKLKEQIDHRWVISPRTMFQRIGTEFGQIKLYRLFPELKNYIPYRTLWVKIFEQWLERHTESLVVITDLRFEHEINAIKSNGGIIVKINRDTGIIDNHISEIEMNQINKDLVDYEIDNNYAVEDLYSQLDTIIYVPF